MTHCYNQSGTASQVWSSLYHTPKILTHIITIIRRLLSLLYAKVILHVTIHCKHKANAISNFEIHSRKGQLKGLNGSTVKHC